MKKSLILQLLIILFAVPAYSQNATWSTTGNTGLPASAFLGTTDLTPLIFKVNNQRSGILDPSSNNTAFGFRSSPSNTTGSANTALGSFAMYANTTGSYNVAIGSSALYQNIAGSNNIAVGGATLLSNTGFQNTAVGSAALVLNTTASDNTAIGSLASYSNTTGAANTSIGSSALFNNTTGSYNVSIGQNSGTSGQFNNTISIGNHGWANGYHNQAFIGNASTGWIGGWTRWSVYSDARIKTKITEDVKGLDFITRLRPVTYYRNIKTAIDISGNKDKADYPEKYDAEKIQTSGFLAQEVEQAATDAGYNFDGVTRPRTKADLYSLSYESFVVPLVKAVQEQQAMIMDQQAMITKQQEQIAALEKKMGAILGSKTDEIKPRFHLTPNPSGDYSVLSCDDKNVLINSLILYNSSGMAVWSQKTPIIPDNPIRIAVQQLSSGLYYLNIQTASGWQSIKLAKQ
jgi:hypothetical protein